MGILQKLRSFLGLDRRSDEAAPSFDPEAFVYITLPGNIQPIERGERFEDRITSVLAERGLGEVSGGGSLLSDARPDGSRVVESCGIDVDVTDREAALSVLRDLLPELQAPAGTRLHYTRNGIRLQDTLSGHGWQQGQGRDDLHPGFGV